jgi:Predicted transporter component
MNRFVALALGALFGVGLYVSGMTNPQKIINFLDIAGPWDLSLIFVMGGGIPVAGLGYYLLKRREKPVLFDDIQVPAPGVIDRPLVIGSAIFGVGWGIAGLCPGPAFASILLEPVAILPYLVALFVGSLAYERLHG